MLDSKEIQTAFFFDTADRDAIEAVWSRISRVLPSASVRGITTNPNGLGKVGVTTVERLESQVRSLCRLMTHIRPDGGAVVYVQQPLSTLDEYEITEWANFLAGLGDGTTPVHMKIPPFPQSLRIGQRLQNEGVSEVNVTGIADCATALRAFSYSPRYVSLIPGRMEEQGIDARSQVQFVQERCPDSSEVIAGSMRNIEGLRWVCELGTVPTIGERVWEKIFDQLEAEELPGLLCSRELPEVQRFAPCIVEAQAELSKAFFDQMDEQGRPICDEFFESKPRTRDGCCSG